MSNFLRIVALVFFVVAALAAWKGHALNSFTAIAAGLACWVGSTL